MYRYPAHAPTNRPLPPGLRLAMGDEAPQAPPQGEEGGVLDDFMTSGQLATTMLLRGAVGVVIGAAVAPEGKEGLWAAAGFAMGATVGEVGIVGIALARMWGKST